MLSYGAWLRAKRQAKGLSQDALGQLVEVSGTYINKIENEVVKRPYPPLRSRIHAVFGTSDADPDLLPYLSRADQRMAIQGSADKRQSPGARLDQLYAIATEDQRSAIMSLLSALDVLIVDGHDDVTIPDASTRDKE